MLKVTVLLILSVAVLSLPMFGQTQTARISGTATPIDRIASRNCSRSSATLVASSDAPISSTPCRASAPDSASATARLSAVWPPTVGSRASGFSRSMIAATVAGDHLEVEVADRGPGFSPEELDKVFEMYYRGSTGQDLTGYGLGLSICYNIIQKHHGRIEVESVLGQGSTFRIYLPAAATPA